jgi:hypothetical protein
VTLIVYKSDRLVQEIRTEIYIRRHELVFPQVSIGTLNSSKLVEAGLILVNGNDQPAVTDIHFRYSTGDPWTVAAGTGSSATSLNLVIPAGSSYQVSFNDRSLNGIDMGWIQVLSDRKLAGAGYSRKLNLKNQLITEVPIVSHRGRILKTALRPGGNPQLFLSVVNPGDEKIAFRIILDENGTDWRQRSRPIELAPGEMLSDFLNSTMSQNCYRGGLLNRFKGGTMTIKVVEGSSQVGVHVSRSNSAGIQKSTLSVGEIQRY